MSEENGVSQESDSLVDQLQADTDNQAAADADKAAGVGVEWFWQDELKGDGDKPDWLTDKYKSVAEQAKAYPELAAKFGSFVGAPEDYEIRVPEDLELPDGITWELDADDPLANAVAEAAKELNMDQAGFDKLISTYIQFNAAQEAEQQQELEQNAATELASIPDGPKRVGGAMAWAKANLTTEEAQAFKENLTDGATLSMYEKLISLSRNSKIPTDQDTFGGAVTKAELEAAYAEKDDKGRNKYRHDPAHREKVERMQKQYVGL